MKKLLFFILSFSHLLIHSFLFFVLFSFSEVYSSTLEVCPSCKTSSVKKALEAGADTIVIKKGTYKEHDIAITKPVYITGEEAVIDGEEKGEIFTVTSNHVTISNLQIRNVGTSYTKDRAGIRITRAKHCIIENNKLENTFFGIYLAHSDSCTIRNNEVTGIPKTESGTGNAIHLWYCKYNLIENNTLKGHRDGIYFEFVENSKITGNRSSEQIRYGLHFMFSHNCEYFKNTFTDNGAGVAVMYSKNIYMHQNTFADNWSPVSNGILLKDISDSRIEKNNIERNTVGIYAEGCKKMMVKNNDFAKNGWAVKILGTCENNTFAQNNFIANTFEVVTNETVSHNLFEKNFWSDYTGYDLNSDGTGDVPHSPVKLFTYLVENIPPAIILLRSLFIDLLNLAEKVTPVITPETLTDNKPVMKQIKW